MKGDQKRLFIRKYHYAAFGLLTLHVEGFITRRACLMRHFYEGPQTQVKHLKSKVLF
jgi:hypothetical protein